MKEFKGKDVGTLSVAEAQAICDEAKPKFAGIVYVYTNKVNGKKYVGQTIHPHTRHASHMKLDHKVFDRTPFHYAVMKYGVDAFEYKIVELFICDDKEELQELMNQSEIELIKLYKTLASGTSGYNVKTGGQFNTYTSQGYGSRPVEMFDMEGNYIRSFKSISEAQIYCGIAGKGIKEVCDRCARTSAGYLWAWKGEQPLIPENRNEVHQYDLEGRYVCSYETMSEAGVKFCGRASSSIFSALQDKYRIAYGYYWRRYKTDILPITDFPKAVYCYDYTGGFIKGYRTLKEAAEDTGASGVSCICGAIRKNQFFRGKLWRRTFTEMLPASEVPPIGVALKITYPDNSVKIYPTIISAALDNQWEIGALKSSIDAEVSRKRLNGAIVEKYKGSLHPSTNENWEFVDLEDIVETELFRPGKLLTPVEQYTKDGKLVREYVSIHEAQRSVGVNNIHGALSRKDCCGGFIWVRKGEPLPEKLLERIDNQKVYQYDADGTYVGCHADKLQAALAIGYKSPNSHIGRCIREPWRTAKGFYWRDIQVDQLDMSKIKQNCYENGCS